MIDLNAKAKKIRDELAKQHQKAVDSEFGNAALELEAEAFQKGFDQGYEFAKRESAGEVSKLKDETLEYCVTMAMNEPLPDMEGTVIDGKIQGSIGEQ